MYSIAYACGSNGKHQLGTQHDEDIESLEVVFQSNDAKVKDIVCGGNHTFIILDSGDIYSSGDNNQGQCGLNDREDLHIKGFHKLDRVDGKPWILASAGYEFSILINNDYDIYACGLGLKGELGLGANNTRSFRLTKIPWTSDGRKITDVKSCLDHSIILLEDGSVYGWGNCRNGKLGTQEGNKLWTPTSLNLSQSVKRIETARDFSVLQFVTGDVVLIGKDRYNIKPQLSTLNHQKIKDFKAMWSSLHLLTDDNQLLSIGNNSHSQLLQIPSDIDIQSYELGSEHGLVHTTRNEVLSWGWGEHGNCGINKKDSDSFDYLNVLFQGSDNEKVELIRGGCATTWIVTRKVDHL